MEMKITIEVRDFLYLKFLTDCAGYIVNEQLEHLNYTCLEDVGLKFAKDAKATLEEDEATIFWLPQYPWIISPGKLANMNAECVGIVRTQFDSFFVYSGSSTRKYQQ